MAAVEHVAAQKLAPGAALKPRWPGIGPEEWPIWPPRPVGVIVRFLRKFSGRSEQFPNTRQCMTSGRSVSGAEARARRLSPFPAGDGVLRPRHRLLWLLGATGLACDGELARRAPGMQARQAGIRPLSRRSQNHRPGIAAL